MGIKLIALDLDGTLLLPDKSLSPRNRAALTAAADRGIHIVPTTGRLFAGLPEVVRALPFVRYAVTVNGGQVEDARSGEVLHSARIPLDLAMEVYAYLDTLPVIYDCYVGGEAFIPAPFYDRMGEFMYDDPHNLAMTRALRKPVDDFKGLLLRRGEPLQKLQCFVVDPADRPAIMDELRRRFPGLDVTWSLPHNIEAGAAAARKGEALRFLCSYLGFTLANAAAFGDGPNDVSMLSAAGAGVAMGNAVPEALAAAKYRTAPNTEDGVARFIEDHIL